MRTELNSFKKTILFPYFPSSATRARKWIQHVSNHINVNLFSRRQLNHTANMSIFSRGRFSFCPRESNWPECTSISQQLTYTVLCVCLARSQGLNSAWHMPNPVPARHRRHLHLPTTAFALLSTNRKTKRRLQRKWLSQEITPPSNDTDYSRPRIPRNSRAVQKFHDGRECSECLALNLTPWNRAYRRCVVCLHCHLSSF